MRTKYLIFVFAAILQAVGCGANSGVAELETYPAVTPEEQKVIDENIESLKDEVR